ncbi:glyoxalase family protein [delta proteobacterium NaphS2]|nr:glyoxalase family protein [delta proteobacterium NaphS2]
MKIHHVCVNVSDMEESLKLYKDVLGFDIFIDEIIPEGDTFEQHVLDDIFHLKGAKSRMVILASEDGTMIELEQPIVPKVQKVPKEQLQYGYVGLSELAFCVDNIDEWFEKIKAAGYETQTDYVWSAGPLRSFLFYDPDGTMVQLAENVIPSET